MTSFQIIQLILLATINFICFFFSFKISKAIKREEIAFDFLCKEMDNIHEELASHRTEINKFAHGIDETSSETFVDFKHFHTRILNLEEKLNNKEKIK